MKTHDCLRKQVREGTWYAIMLGGGESYLSTFAAFLHATPLQLGMLACLPPIVGASLQFVSLLFIRQMELRKPVLVVGACAQAAAWFPILLLPALFPSDATLALIIAVTLYYAMGDVTYPAWQSLIGDLVPEEKRGDYFSRRGTQASFAAFVSLCAAGVILHVAETLDRSILGFTVVFAGAAIARALSAMCLRYLPESTSQFCLQAKETRIEYSHTRNQAFRRFVGFSTAMHMAMGLAGPFFTVYVIRDLHWTFLQYGLWLAAPVLAQMLTLRDWGKLADHYGNKLVLLLTSVVVSLVPLIYVISTEWLVLVASNFITGLVWPAFLLGLQNYLFDIVPAAVRPKGAAIWSTGNAFGTAAGALAGMAVLATFPSHLFFIPALSHTASSLVGLFLLSTLLRLATVLSLRRNCEDARPVPSISGSELLYQLPLLRRVMRVGSGKRAPA